MSLRVAAAAAMAAICWRGIRVAWHVAAKAGSLSAWRGSVAA